MTIPDGYHPREDGAMAFLPSGSSRKCDSCGAEVGVLIGFERDYPDDPDIEVCGQCHDLWLFRDPE